MSSLPEPAAVAFGSAEPAAPPPPPSRQSPARRLALAAYAVVEEAYVRLASRGPLLKLNERLLQATLRARGYNNLAGFEASGEACFLDRVARLRPRVCLDVGANVGQYSTELLRRTGTVVHAFEPMPRSLERLRALAGLHPGRLCVHPWALGDAAGHVPIEHGEDDSQIASLNPATRHVDYVGTSNVRRTTVEVRRLDDVLASGALALDGREVDLLKIDTEGYEYNVLLGAADLLRAARPRLIQIEFNWHQLFCGHSLWQFANLLPEYDVHQLLPRRAGWRRVDPRASLSNVYCYSNFVFARRGLVLPD